MPNMVNDNYVRYLKLKKLLLAVNLNLQGCVDVHQENTDFQECIPEELTKKHIFKWNSLSLIKFIESRKHFILDSELDYIKMVLKQLDDEKEQICRHKYTLYYKKITKLFNHCGAYSKKLKYLDPSPNYQVDEINAPPAIREDVLKGIHGCVHFSQIIETFFGPEWSNDEVEISDYIEKQINEPEFEHPAVKSMIKAAKTQKLIHGDGMKSVLIVCAALLEDTEFLLLEVSPQEIVNGYELTLSKTLKFLETLICCEKNDCRFVAGAGATEIQLAVKLFSLVRGNTNLGPEELCINSFSAALIKIPETLIENAGLCPENIIIELEKEHEKGNNNIGFDIKGDDIFIDTVKNQIFDNYHAKRSAIEYAARAACSIIKDFQLQKQNLGNDGR